MFVPSVDRIRPSDEISIPVVSLPCFNSLSVDTRASRTLVAKSYTGNKL